MNVLVLVIYEVSFQRLFVFIWTTLWVKNAQKKPMSCQCNLAGIQTGTVSETDTTSFPSVIFSQVSDSLLSPLNLRHLLSSLSSPPTPHPHLSPASFDASPGSRQLTADSREGRRRRRRSNRRTAFERKQIYMERREKASIQGRSAGQLESCPRLSCYLSHTQPQQDQRTKPCPGVRTDKLNIYIYIHLCICICLCVCVFIYTSKPFTPIMLWQKHFYSQQLLFVAHIDTHAMCIPNVFKPLRHDLTRSKAGQEGRRRKRGNKKPCCGRVRKSEKNKGGCEEGSEAAPAALSCQQHPGNCTAAVQKDSLFLTNTHA